jgi:hypothetical protein
MHLRVTAAVTLWWQSAAMRRLKNLQKCATSAHDPVSSTLAAVVVAGLLTWDTWCASPLSSQPYRLVCVYDHYWYCANQSFSDSHVRHAIGISVQSEESVGERWLIVYVNPEMDSHSLFRTASITEWQKEGKLCPFPYFSWMQAAIWSLDLESPPWQTTSLICLA